MSESLHSRIIERVAAWRADGYPCPNHPAIAEILEWARDLETGSLRYLRPPQFQALEVYWYLRSVEGTPHVLDLYRSMFPPEVDLPTYLNALGIPEESFRASNYSLSRVISRIRDDAGFTRQHRLEALRETLTLEYPSYIMALAMGAGKTVLIGAIVATEFALALEHADGPFVRNALVFAPGTTIIESLRELAVVPYAQILPPRLYKPFSTSFKLTFTRDGEKDVPFVRGSSFNLVVTNTEKIRIQRRPKKWHARTPVHHRRGSGSRNGKPSPPGNR